MKDENRRELVMQTLRGEHPSRVPFSFWYHFRTMEWFPAAIRPDSKPIGRAVPEILEVYTVGMTEAELLFWERYQPDILKVMHDIPYEMPPEMPVVREMEDWLRLPVLPPEEGHFGAQLTVLRQIRARLREDVPMVETLFNAFYYANKVSEGRLKEHLQKDAQTVLKGVQAIQESLLQYAQACLKSCDGIYYALSGASEDTLPREIYHAYFRPLDQQLLEAIAAAPLNVLHLHGYGQLYADLVAEMPAAIVCWSDRSTNLSLQAGRKQFQRCVMGGLNELNLPGYTVEQARQEAQEAIQQVGGEGFILAPGCAIATDTRPELLDAIREAVGLG